MPWEWPWSSARAHTLDAAVDPVLDCNWEERFGRWDYAEWKEILSVDLEGADLEAVRRATRTGEPLGSRGFIASLERRAGKRLRVGERSRPKAVPQSPDEASRQG